MTGQSTGITTGQQATPPPGSQGRGWAWATLCTSLGMSMILSVLHYAGTRLPPVMAFLVGMTPVTLAAFLSKTAVLAPVHKTFRVCLFFITLGAMGVSISGQAEYLTHVMDGYLAWAFPILQDVAGLAALYVVTLHPAPNLETQARVDSGGTAATGTPGTGPPLTGPAAPTGRVTGTSPVGGSPVPAQPTSEGVTGTPTGGNQWGSPAATSEGSLVPTRTAPQKPTSDPTGVPQAPAEQARAGNSGRPTQPASGARNPAPKRPPAAKPAPARGVARMTDDEVYAAVELDFPDVVPSANALVKTYGVGSPRAARLSAVIEARRAGTDTSPDLRIIDGATDADEDAGKETGTG